MKRVYWNIVLGIMVAGFAANLAVNVIVDPYKVFGICDFNRKNFEVNSRYLKTEYLKGHNGYDTFIFGTSRAQAYAEETVEELTGGTAFNFWVPGENMEGVFRKISWIIESGHGMRRAIICLDYDFMFTYENIDRFDLLRQEHYLVSGEHRLGFYARYLSFQPTVIRKALRANLFTDSVHYRFDRETGRDIFPGRVDKAPAGKRQLLPDNVTLPEMGLHFRQLQMDAFRAVVKLLGEKDIEAVYVINPCYYLLMFSYNMQDYHDWLAGLAAQGALIWDFSGFNRITMDEANYSDLSHFNKAAGDMVLQRVLGKVVTDKAKFILSMDTLEHRIQALSMQYERNSGKRSPGNSP
ncbi:MAG TPA: hypothetical protein ENN05_01655 [Deltaproteobacteria bacterium]|nr:hypothetical protein [Deltaproteobacteria bacterium]